MSDWWKLIVDAALTGIQVTAACLIFFVAIPTIQDSTDRLMQAREADAKRGQAVEAMRAKEMRDLADIAVEIGRIKRQLKGEE
jgi:hypothetical protein